MLPPAALELIELGINHEQQHQELLLTDILATFAENPLEPAYGECRRRPHRDRAAELHPGREGVVEIGAAGDGFAFDSERPRHRVFLDGACDRQRSRDQCRMARVHRRRRLFDPDAVAIRRLGLGPREGIDSAALLARGRDRIHARRTARDRLGRAGRARLLLRSRRLRPLGRSAAADRGRMGELRRGRRPRLGNQLDEAGAVVPRPGGGLFGDVWEWTQSAFSSYPGFAPAEGAVGEYNGKFMSGQMVLKGGSCATPRGHSRASYRNFFPPSARWQFTGLRLARDA